MVKVLVWNVQPLIWVSFRKTQLFKANGYITDLPEKINFFRVKRKRHCFYWLVANPEFTFLFLSKKKKLPRNFFILAKFARNSMLSLSTQISLLANSQLVMNELFDSSSKWISLKFRFSLTVHWCSISSFVSFMFQMVLNQFNIALVRCWPGSCRKSFSDPRRLDNVWTFWDAYRS